MNQSDRVQFRLNKTGLVLCTVLSMLIILFSNIVCEGQEEEYQKLSSEEYAKSLKYETPGILNVHDILPPELIESEHHTVMKDVATYDLTNRFTILSTFGPFEAIGKDMLRIRVQEIQAIAVLQEIKKTKAFRDAAEQAAMSSYKNAKILIIHPANTVSGVPKGAGRLFSRTGEMSGVGRGDSEDSITKELVGFSAVKRQYAHKMGVDVYSSNEVLQKDLNSVAWAGFAGGVGVSLAMMPVRSASTVAYISIKATKFVHGMNQILLDNAPEDLRRMNREKLLEMGVDESVIEEFLRNPNFSPRHETILVHALAEMEGVSKRDQFIKQALFAESELDAFVFQRIAEMLYGYHTEVGPISEIIPVRRIAVGYASDQTIVIALPMDYIYWAERAALGLDAIRGLQSERSIKQTELWVTGRVTPKARKEIEARGLIINEQIGERLMLPSTQE